MAAEQAGQFADIAAELEVMLCLKMDGEEMFGNDQQARYSSTRQLNSFQHVQRDNSSTS